MKIFILNYIYNMGNTITYENNRYNPVLPHGVNGPESEANQNLLRKFIQDELMKRKEIINGNEVEINKLKVYCRSNPEMNNQSNASTKADYEAIGTDTISLALPYVSNTAPIFSSTTANNNNELKSEIKTAYVPFNYKGTDTIKITEDNNKNPMSFEKKHCSQYIGAICGKQIIDNNCIVDKNIKLDTNIASITIDPNNAKCFKEKTESGQLINSEKRAYNAEQKILILKNLSDMALSVTNGGLLSRDFDFLGTNGATREMNNFDDYITTYYNLCDYLKAPWNDSVYRTGTSSAYVKLTLTANQAGEPVFKYENNQVKMYHPNTSEGKTKIGNIYLRKDIFDFNNWNSTTSKYFKNQQNIDTVIFDSGNFHNKKTGTNYNDDSSYDMLPRTGQTEVNKFLSTDNKGQKRRLHAYFNIRRMIILNFIYATELIVKPAGTTDKTFNSGEPLCSCVNSVYGPNLQTQTKSTCLGVLSHKTEQEIKDLADTIYTSPDKFAEEARRCLGWNVRNLTTYLIKINGSNIVVDNNSPSNLNKPMRISYAEGLKNMGNMAVITPKINTLTWQGKAIPADAKTLLIKQIQQVFDASTIAKNQNYIIPGSKSTTVPGHNYQVKLDDSLYSVGTGANDSA